MKNALTFTLRLVEPLLATQAESSEANSATTLAYVPGSMVRGAVIGCYLNNHMLDAADPLAQRLFFSGAAQFLNAYPSHPVRAERMLPRPASWRVEKDEVGNRQAQLRDLAIQDWVLDNPKAPGGSFVWHGDDGVQLVDTRLHVTVHTASQDRNRKAEGASQVYRYEALAAGQVLAGAIVADNADDLELIKPWLSEVNRLGGAQTAGYGSVVVENIRTQGDWQEYRPAAALPDRVVITLLSDALVRDGSGGLADTPGAALGITAEPDKAFRRLHVVGGFNRKWGLPLPQGWAIEAGSVFVYPAAGLDRAALQEAAARGIGERTAEGYGRVAVDWHTLAAQKQGAPNKPTAPDVKPAPMSTESKALAQRMAGRRLQAQLDRALVTQIVTLTGGAAPFGNLPSAAQLSRARLAARQAWETGQLAAISDHFDSLKTAAKDWERARLQKTRLLDWIKELVELDDETFKRKFELAAGLPEVAGETADMDPQAWQLLRARTTARLIEGVLKQAVKRKKEVVEGGQP